MTKYLCRLECDRVKFYKMKKGPRPMVTLNSRLYRIDDCIMVKDRRSPMCMAVYPIDSSQPMLPEPFLVDPDMTRVYIDSARIAGTKKSLWADLQTGKITELLGAVIVIGVLLYTFLSGAGL